MITASISADHQKPLWAGTLVYHQFNELLIVISYLVNVELFETWLNVNTIKPCHTH